eukprot:16432144-Heterocapsa_arctica.AAC.1
MTNSSIAFKPVRVADELENASSAARREELGEDDVEQFAQILIMRQHALVDDLALQPLDRVQVGRDVEQVHDATEVALPLEP